jgi:hypothetical protein
MIDKKANFQLKGNTHDILRISHTSVERIEERTVKKVNDFPFPSRDVSYQTLPGRE